MLVIIAMLCAAATASVPPLLHNVLVSVGRAEMWACTVVLYMVRGIALTTAFCGTTIMLQQAMDVHRGAVNGMACRRDNEMCCCRECGFCHPFFSSVQHCMKAMTR